MTGKSAGDCDAIGLCATCAHVRRVESDKGSVFFLCQLALTDQRFKKDPPLPVLQCDGHVPVATSPC